MDDATAVPWVFVDDWRIAISFFGVALGLVLLGIVSVLAWGSEASLAGAILLSAATFLSAFSAFLIVPRLFRRGVRSFRLVVDQSIEQVEGRVRQALESEGRAVQVHRVGRGKRNVRVLEIGGTPWRFRLEERSSRESSGGLLGGTEVIQASVLRSTDPDAARLRMVVGLGLSGVMTDG